jgi:nicotinate-nucleotide adenylyltransferase
MGVRAATGIFGGSFDPPHLGHLAAAQEAQHEFGLDEVLFVPTHRNPLKLEEPPSGTEHRVAMTAAAIAGNARFRLSRADVDRPGPWYTVNLLQLLRDQFGPDHELVFIVGMDVVYELHLWREPTSVLELARLVAVSRPGQPTLDPAELNARIPGAAHRVSLIQTPGVAISSTELRQRIAEGKPVRYLIGDAVIEYVQRHRLYLEA